MAEKKATVPFSGTKEQEEALMKVIHELKDEKGALMPILQKAQVSIPCRSHWKYLP